LPARVGVDVMVLPLFLSVCVVALDARKSWTAH
jgi:hypothetical protein